MFFRSRQAMMAAVSAADPVARLLNIWLMVSMVSNVVILGRLVAGPRSSFLAVAAIVVAAYVVVSAVAREAREACIALR
jgi:hypothetical protein